MYTVRAAGEDDIPRLAGLLSQLYTLETQFTPDPERQTAGLTLCLARPELCRILVIETGGEAVGMANLQFFASTANGLMSVHIDDYIIDEAHRGRGAGSRLMDAVEEVAREIGANRVTVNVDAANGPGLGFYLRRGFETMNLVKHHKRLEP